MAELENKAEAKTKAQSDNRAKGTKEFSETIKLYLEDMAFDDIAFREKYLNPEKSIDECCNYIFTQVKNSGCCGFTDNEIFGMAVHYYEESSEDLGKIEKLSPVTVVNHHVELTEEEKVDLKKKAVEDYQKRCIEELRPKKPSAKKQSEKVDESQLSLFQL